MKSFVVLLIVLSACIALPMSVDADTQAQYSMDRVELGRCPKRGEPTPAAVMPPVEEVPVEEPVAEEPVVEEEPEPTFPWGWVLGAVLAIFGTVIPLGCLYEYKFGKE